MSALGKIKLISPGYNFRRSHANQYDSTGTWNVLNNLLNNYVKCPNSYTFWLQWSPSTKPHALKSLIMYNQQQK